MDSRSRKSKIRTSGSAVLYNMDQVRAKMKGLDNPLIIL